jgi:aspartyl-tRNA(Asn)/glutamyl-tRNA(Gln) amidotransferase subunit A
VPGGSSSGAAASVAFGLAAAGIGSDTGGSVRIPSAFNDLVGLKTTHGRLSNEGVVPLVESLDTVGPLCRSVEDCAALLAVMEGGAMADLTGASLEGARLLVLENYTDDVREAGCRLRLGLRGCRRRGRDRHAASISRGRRSNSRRRSGAGEAYGIWRDAIEAAPDKMFDRVRERFRGGCGQRARLRGGDAAPAGGPARLAGRNRRL